MMMPGAVFELDRSSYSERKNTLGLTSSYIYASHAGCIVHAVMGWEENEVGEVNWAK